MKSFLLIGQSNMAGRGDFGEVPEIINEHCFMLRNGIWERMAEPINPDKPIFNDPFHSGVGLSASFADECAKYFNEDIGLIPCASGGTRVDQWQPNGQLFMNAFYQTKLAMNISELSGILWHQGEQDSKNMDDVNAYYDRFMNMITNLKEMLGVGDIPLMIGELGDFVGGYKNGADKYFTETNKVLKKLSGDIKNCEFVSAKGLTCRWDSIHFNSASLREFGKRYFNAYKEILNKMN